MVRRLVCGFLLFFIAALAALSWISSPVEAAPPRPTPKAVRPNPLQNKEYHRGHGVEGIITAITTTTVSITPFGSSTPIVLTLVTTPVATVIKLDGVVAPLTSLATGMRAEAYFQVAGTTNNAVQIRAYDISRVEGTITAVTATTVTVTPFRSTTPVVLTAVTTPVATVITLDGAPVALTALLVGMRAEAAYKVTNSANNAVQIRARDMLRVEGTITAINGTTVTIARANGTTVDLLAATAVITLDGATAALTSLLPGMRAEASYTASAAGNTASRIRAYDMLRVEGAITAVTATTVTITPFRAGSTPVVLTVLPATVITLDGAPVTVAAFPTTLLLGMRAAAAYQVTGTVGSVVNNASQIRARDLLRVEGTISAVDMMAGTVTITRRDGTTMVTVIVVAATTLNVDGVTGTGPAGAPFTSLVTGMRAEAAYQVTAAGNTASALRARTP